MSNSHWLPNGQPPRAISLTRVSRDPKFESTSHETQHAGNLRCIADLGASLVRHYAETVSGALYHAREETQAALDDLEADRADYLILYDMSRYGRSVRWQQEILHRVEQAGKRIQFAQFRLDYDERENRLTLYSRSLFNTFGNASETERLMIRERTVRGLRKMAEDGKQPARGFDPYGYHCITRADVIRGLHPKGSEGTYVLNENECALPPLIFEKYCELRSYRDLASWLNENGYATRSGNPWRPSSLLAMLSRRIYKGEATYSAKKWMTDESRLDQGKSMQYARKRPPEDAIVIPAPPLVSVELWNEVQTISGNGNSERSGPRAKRYALTGLVFCPSCGKRMYTMREGGSDKKGQSKGLSGQARYAVRCGAAARPTPQHESHCDPRRFSGTLLEQMTRDALVELLCDPRLLEDAAERYRLSQRKKQKPDGGEKEIERLQREIEKLAGRERIAATAAIEARLAGSDGAAYEQLRAQAESRRRELDSTLATLVLEKQNETLPERPLESLGDNDGGNVAEKIARVLNAPDVSAQEKHELLSRLVLRVYPLAYDEIKRQPGQRYHLAGAQIVLKTAQPGPWYLLRRRITRRGRFNAPVAFTTELEISATPPLPGL